MNTGSGAPDGFAEYVAVNSPALLRAAWLLTGDAAKAEDLLQTVLAKLWTRWRRIDEIADLNAYARRMLYHTYLSWWRRRWHGEIPTATLPDTDDGTDLATAVATRSAVAHSLARLTRRQRAVVLLRLVDDRSVLETAELLRCTTGTVKAHCSRALAVLRADPSLRALIEEPAEEKEVAS